MRKVSVTLPACGLLLAGCAIHPLPEDVTRETTYAIVQKIRCEAREALDDISVRLLRTSDYPPTLDVANRIAAKELTVIELFESKNRRKYADVLRSLSPDVTHLFQAYTTTAVTFDFNFEITEDNNHSVTAKFGLPFKTGTFGLTASADANLSRKGKRQFQVVNSFFELHELPAQYCANIAAKSGNFVYPIVGKIGIEEVFETFVDIDNNVLPGGILPAKQHNNTPTFTDTLTFTTVLDASIKPSITINPLKNGALRLSEASATFGPKRTDMHQLTLSLAKGQSIRSVEDARMTAKTLSKVNADQRRMEDLFIIPRNSVQVISR